MFTPLKILEASAPTTSQMIRKCLRVHPSWHQIRIAMLTPLLTLCSCTQVWLTQISCLTLSFCWLIFFWILLTQYPSESECPGLSTRSKGSRFPFFHSLVNIENRAKHLFLGDSGWWNWCSTAFRKTTGEKSRSRLRCHPLVQKLVGRGCFVLGVPDKTSFEIRSWFQVKENVESSVRHVKKILFQKGVCQFWNGQLILLSCCCWGVG